MVKNTWNSIKLRGRYGGVTGKTLVEGVGKQVFTCWNFGAKKREKVDHINACKSVHRTNQSILNKVKYTSASKHE